MAQVPGRCAGKERRWELRALLTSFVQVLVGITWFSALLRQYPSGTVPTWFRDGPLLPSRLAYFEDCARGRLRV